MRGSRIKGLRTGKGITDEIIVCLPVPSSTVSNGQTEGAGMGTPDTVLTPTAERDIRPIGIDECPEEWNSLDTVGLKTSSLTISTQDATTVCSEPSQLGSKTSFK